MYHRVSLRIPGVEREPAPPQRPLLSAFSNTDGGTVLLGVDEQSGFSLVELADPAALRDALVQMSRDDITPPLHYATSIMSTATVAEVGTV